MTPKIDLDICELVKEAKNAEFSRDIKTLRAVLEPVWSDIKKRPEISEYSEEIKAEILRLCGFYLTFYGRANNLNYCQETARNFLFQSAAIFESLNLAERSAEAKITLAFCYWNSGEVSETDLILNTIEKDFSGAMSHPLFIRVQINRLLIFYWNKENKRAERLIGLIRNQIVHCPDAGLKSMFYNEAAIIYSNLKKYDLSANFYSESIKWAKIISNHRFIAVNYNNLAMLHQRTGDFPLAHSYADKSLEIYNDLGDTGWIPHVLDTKSLIYLKQRKYSSAIQMIEKAIEYFYLGEDVTGLTEALWTKIRCLLAMNEKVQALTVFTELQQIALEKVGEIAATKYTNLFAGEIYVKKGLSFNEEVSAFKVEMISKALIETNGEVGSAAKILGLKNHQALSEILERQFPELRSSLGFSRRAARSLKISKSKKNTNSENIDNGTKVVQIKATEILQETPVKKLILAEIKGYTFDFPFKSPTFEVYHFTESQMQQFGIDEEAVIAVFPLEEFEINEGKMVLASNASGFIVDTIKRDSLTEFYYVNDLSGRPVLLDELTVIGEPAGFCPISKGSDMIEFSRLKLKK